MVKQHILHGLKVLIIILLVIAISMLVIIRWKSDIIIGKVLSTVQHELVDSLQYTTADMNWFSHFPMMSIRIYDLSVGSSSSPFIHHSDIDVVIGVWPLLKNEILVKKLAVKDGTISITESASRWSYDIFKKKDKSGETEYATKVNQLVLENTMILYRDKQSNHLSLSIQKGVFKGSIVNDIMETSISLQCTANELAMSGYTLPTSFQSSVTGEYSIDMNTGAQQFDDFIIDHDALQLVLSGTLAKDTIDMDLQWKKTNPEKIMRWFPKHIADKTTDYQVKGSMEGHARIKGLLSNQNALSIIANTTLQNGTVHFLSTKKEIKGLTINIDYTGISKPELKASFSKSGNFGPSFSGSIHIANLQKPVYDIAFDGKLPAPLLNLVESPGLHFANGEFDIDNLILKNINPSSFSINTLFNQTTESIQIKNVQLTYHNNALTIEQANLRILDHQANMSIDKMTWNEATITDVNSAFESNENNLKYSLSGKLCEGEFSTSGEVNNIAQRPTINGSSVIKQIKIDQLLHSFSDFDQTFITSENLSGKTNLWTQYNLPFDRQWNLQTKQMVVKSAIDINDGRLKGIEAFEEFSRFVDLEDLKDIRFNQMRNYMLIEQGKVIFPVMFIQTNALNLSISGQHGFDEKIIYFLKLNAGQVAAKKLKKKKGHADYVKASKSGWINMYFALEGTTQNLKYRQYKKAVIAGFEQSRTIKETLRDELVEQFGYDVYWLEPNEWEDIPEYQ